MNSIISVRGLGKSYHLVHQTAKGSKRYRTLRDDLADMAVRFVKGDWSRQTGEDFWALRDINFDIKQGEIVGILGRNGAGKSTLLKVLSRITPPTEGEAFMRGRVGSLLEVGTGFHPELTGRENIFLSGSILGMKRREVMARFDEIVAFAEIEQFVDMPVKRYSSGMYARLAFAVAAHLETEILFVDEVLSVGDAAFQKKCMGKMQDVGKSGRTILFVSHNTEALARLCTSCIYLVGGRLKMQGDTHEVIKEYADHFKQAAGEIDLTPLPRRFESNGAARMLRLRSLQNASSSGSWCYDYGTPLGFSVEFEVIKTLEAPDIGYSIFSTTGMELVSTITHQEQPLDRLLPGRYQMHMTIPDLPLNPGTYMIALGITTLGRSADHIMDAVQIEIIPNKLSAQKGLDKIWAPITPHTVFELISS